jgi:F-type H+-transporting ATPase subunit epsilon
MAKTLYCTVVTPEKLALDTHADFVAVPLYDGEMGIAPGHSAVIGRLGCGELRLRSGSRVTRYFVDGGFVQIAHDRVTVLTRRTLSAAEIDRDAARRQLQEAVRSVAATPEACTSRDRLIAQARGQLWVARRDTH